MKEHRVGTVTLGIMMILFGVLFLIHMLIPALSYDLIYRIWPIMIIALGVEVLLANRKSEKIRFVYDKGAVFLMIIICFFSMSMATIEVLIHF
ncbi:MAG: LiaI-LiaF-like domain-containing protein [Lachnotalea sp.]